MALHRLYHLSSLLRSAVSLTLRRKSASPLSLFNKGKDLDPSRTLFLPFHDVSCMNFYLTGVLSPAGALAHRGKRLYGGGDMTKFPEIKFTGEFVLSEMMLEIFSLMYAFQ
uniref:Uncharacterized protein n=1 Tax=Labrus bergylta TaxID=56723 RepID=A0A3Q3FI60_9LABR